MRHDQRGTPAAKARRRLRVFVNSDVREGVARVEAFSDGVFGIAATLLVIDIKLPPDLPDARRLVDALVGQWPGYLGYVMSFMYIGIYWAHHHNVFQHFKRTDHVFLKLNLVFLMLIAVMPFPTAVLGAYARARDERELVAAVLYNAVLLVTSILFLSLWLYGTRKHRLVDRDLDPALIRSTTLRYAIGPVCYSVALVTAFGFPSASLLMDLAVAAFYLLPVHVSAE
jgi:uncharacterized membrane protein